MTLKTKSIIRKLIYLIIFAAMIFGFIYLGNKYAGNSEIKTLDITDYYKNIDKENFKVIRGGKFISLFKKGKHVIVIGNSNSEYSKKYIKEINEIIENNNIEGIYYYDIVNDKAQGNSNYYELLELLNGYLVTTDMTENNLLSPSLYIIDNGKVKYYNVETTAMKNTDTVSDYWSTEKELEFEQELTEAINKYYLNK